MRQFTKLDADIIHKSIWSQPSDIRIVWITLLAMADADGVVHASLGGLARAAQVNPDTTAEAVRQFCDADPDSSDPDNDGRRMERVQGGWRLLNHHKYRSNPTQERRRERDRIRKQQQRERAAKSSTNSPEGATGTNERRAKPAAPAGEANPSPQGQPAPSAPPPKPEVMPEIPAPLLTPDFERVWNEWVAFRRKLKKPGSWATMFTKQLESLAEFGPAVAIATLNASMTNGWTGLFPEKISAPAGRPAKRDTSTPDDKLF